MKKQKSTKRALLMSALAMLMCVSMLIGSTFAWFTDSVTSGNNKIIAGNLDIELEYANEPNGTYHSVVGAKDIFVAPAGSPKGLWEPGHTEVAYLKITNAGTLALKYDLMVAPFTETVGQNADGEDIVLSDILLFSATEPSETVPTAYTRESAQAAAIAGAGTKLTKYAENSVVIKPNTVQYVTLVVYMPEEVGNEANYRGETVPSIEFAISLMATQQTHEEDSFGNNYDELAPVPVPVNPNGNTVVTVGAFTFYVPYDAVADNGNSLYFEPIPEDYAPSNAAAAAMEGKKAVRRAFDITATGLAENNTTPIRVEYKVSGTEEYKKAYVFHNGTQIEAEYDVENRIISFEATDFSPYEFILDYNVTVVPENTDFNGLNALLKVAKPGDVIDGDPDGDGVGMTFSLGSKASNTFNLIQDANGVTIQNMTFTGSGSGSTIMVYSANKSMTFKNVTFVNNTGKALEISTNSRTNLLFEDCTITGKAYVQGNNTTFKNCSFSKNMNLESATNYTFDGCTFSFAGSITIGAKLNNVLIENCKFTGKSSNIIRISKYTTGLTNVRVINNTYATSSSTLISPDSQVKTLYETAVSNGNFVFENNTKV